MTQVDDIICIGTSHAVDVNVYRSGGFPIVEVMKTGQRLSLTPAQAEGLIDNLQDAIAFWQEEGKSHPEKTAPEGERVPQVLTFFPPDEPLPIGTVLKAVEHDDVTDMHWGKCTAVVLAIVRRA